MKRAGNRAVTPARATTTSPDSRGWRRASSTSRPNSGASSRNRQPRWARDAAPGRMTPLPPPTIAALLAVWCGAQNGGVASSGLRSGSDAGHRMDGGDLQRRRGVQAGQHGRDALGQHGLAGPWRPEQAAGGDPRPRRSRRPGGPRAGRARQPGRGRGRAAPAPAGPGLPGRRRRRSIPPGPPRRRADPRAASRAVRVMSPRWPPGCRAPGQPRPRWPGARPPGGIPGPRPRRPRAARRGPGGAGHRGPARRGTRHPSMDAMGTTPAALRMATAIPTSKPLPRLGRLAGDRPTVIRRCGHCSRLLMTAARIRSLASRSAVSGRPTSSSPGRPF